MGKFSSKTLIFFFYVCYGEYTTKPYTYSKPYYGRMVEKKSFSHYREATKMHKPNFSFCCMSPLMLGDTGTWPWCHEKEVYECLRTRCLMLIGYMEKQKM